MGKAEWIKLSQESGSGDASVAVSSNQIHTGREARTSIITWVAEDVEPIKRTVIQEGAGARTILKGGNHITTNAKRFLLYGISNDAGLGFRTPSNNTMPYQVDSEMNVAGVKVTLIDDVITKIPGDPGAKQTYSFNVGVTITPSSDEPPTEEQSGFITIVGVFGDPITVTIKWVPDEKRYIIVPEGDIVLDADGTPVTIEVQSNTSWVIE